MTQQKTSSRRGLLLGVLGLLAVPVLLVLLLRLIPESRDEAPVRTPEPTTAQRPDASVLRVNPQPTASAEIASQSSGLLLRGTVRSAQNRAPIANATLVFLREGLTGMVRANAEGVFEFRPERAGNWGLASLSADGFSPFSPELGHSPLSFELRPNEPVEGVELTLVPLVEFDGTIVSASGQPVEGAEVRVETAEGAPIAALTGAHRSDAAGHLRVRAPERSVLTARHPAHGPGRVLLDESAWLTRRFTIRLEAPTTGFGTVTGVVTSPTGELVDGALVTARNLDRRMFREGQTASGGDGRFRIENLPAGRYLISAYATGFQAIADSATVISQQTADVTLRLLPEAIVRGRVRDRATGQPVRSFTVIATPLGPGWSGPPLTASDQRATGEFEVHGLPSTIVDLRVEAPGYATSDPVQVRARTQNAEPIEVQLDRGASLRGRVVAEGSRTPIEGARIELDQSTRPTTMSANAAANASIVRSPLAASSMAFSASDGTFTLENVPPGARSLRVMAPGYHGRVVGGLTVSNDRPNQEQLITLRAINGDEGARVEVETVPARLSNHVTRVMFQDVSVEQQSAGLQRYDEIVSIDGHPIADGHREEALELLRGAAGTSAHIVVRRRNELSPIEIDLPRARVLANEPPPRRVPGAPSGSATPSARPSGASGAPAPSGASAPAGSGAPSASASASGG